MASLSITLIMLTDIVPFLFYFLSFFIFIFGFLRFLIFFFLDFLKFFSHICRRFESFYGFCGDFHKQRIGRGALTMA